MTRRYIMVFLALVMLVFSVGARAIEDSPEKTAQRVAESWMPLWDSGRYNESYDLLAEDTKRQIPKRQWFIYWTAVRKPLGKLKSRKLIEAEFIKSLPGIPDQAGAVIRYDSSFENEVSIVETFGMIREKDGTWRVANYITPDRR